MKGIAVAGTLLVDSLNVIGAYPKESELTKIINTSMAVGGCVPNVGIDLKKLSPDTEIFAIGKVGNDDYAQFINQTFMNNGVDISGIKKEVAIGTSFTQVMSVKGGTRTFFTYAGASSTFGFSDIDLQNLNASMLHLGYFLLLDKIDNSDGLKILKRAVELGIKTSIDLVSENSDRYKLVIPCLQYTHNLIINEVEAGNLTGMPSTLENMPAITRKLKDLGVKERVIIHAPTYSVCLSENGFITLGCLNVPKDFIKGTTGAGDAFCSGALLAIYRNLSDYEILEMATACATISLSTTDATSGLKPVEQIMQECKKFKRSII